jgi:hypothetical protein
MYAMIHQSIVSPIGRRVHEMLRRALKQGNDVRLGKHDQLAKGTARLGSFNNWPQLGRSLQGTLQQVLQRLGSGASHEGLILERIEQQMTSLISLKLPDR